MEFDFNKIKNSKTFRLVVIVCLGTIVMWGVMKYVMKPEERIARERRVIPGEPTEEVEEVEKIRELLGKEALFGREEEIIPIRAYKVSRVDFKDSLPVVGTLRSIPEINLRFEVNGVISSMNFKEGDRIRKGDVIATLNRRDAELELSWAQAKHRTALSEVKTSKKRLEVLESLYNVGAIIKTRIEESKLELETSRRRTEQAYIGVESAEARLKKTYLYAPRDGVLGLREAEAGEFVTPNDRIAILFVIDNLFVEVGIIERDIHKIRPRQRATVIVDAHPDRTFPGTITSIFPMIEGRSRTLTTRIKVRNPRRLLLPGMFARVEIYVFSRPNAIVVPSTAISIHADRHQVSVVEEERVRTRAVTLEYLTTDYAVIRTGLRVEEIVVVGTPGMRKLKDGTRVEIIELQKQAFVLE